MSGRIHDDDVALVRERARIDEIIADHTALRPAGGGRLKGLCPFHQEKTPSFSVDAAKGFYHCFGCSAGGDVFTFLKQREGLEFTEAVEKLAARYGIALRYEQLRSGQRRALGRRTRITEVLGEAAAFYADALLGEAGEPACGYLAGRGVAGEALAAFRLGWAPDRWDGLVRHLGGDVDPELLVEAGLATRGQRGLIDRFRARIMFPILDPAGTGVIGFGGRTLPGAAIETGPRDGTPPKYINSAESPVYKKAEVLYGLSWARRAIVAEKAALVVEGYMDVIGLHLAGVRHAVATCGTALTAEHLRTLERLAPGVVLALDADAAGLTAAERARALAEEAGMTGVAVLPLPTGSDPADLAQRGASAVREALAQTRTAVEFQLEHLLRDTAGQTPEAQVAAYRATFPLLARLGDRALRYRYMRDVVAPAVGLSAQRIEEEFDAWQPEGSRSRQSAAPVAPPAPVARTQLDLERLVLQNALQLPELLPAEWDKVTEADFTAAVSRSVFAALRAAEPGDLAQAAPSAVGRSLPPGRPLGRPPGDLDAVLAALPDDDLRGRVRGLALRDTETTPDEAHVRQAIAALRARTLEREHEALRTRLRDQAGVLEPEQERALQQQLAELERRRRAVRGGTDGG